MALTFTDRKWHDETTGTVTFPAWSGSTRVTCRITDEALHAVFGSGHSDTELLECFEQCRASIEAAAIKKFDASGDALKLVLVTGDFDTRAPAKAEPQAKSASEIARMMKDYRATGGGKAPTLVHSAELDAAMAALEEASAESGSAEEPVPESAAAADSATTH
jgi:hypothetical protein